MSKPDFNALKDAVQSAKKLYSIFDRISLGHASGQLNNQHKARLLTIDNIVKGDETPVSAATQALKGELNFLENLDENAQTDTFFYLLQKYGWRIADPQKEEETSLAVAYCDSYRVNEALKNAGDDDTYILAKGDFSGIQGYIYGNIQPKRTGGMVGIAKKLRGRSIIVSLLTDFLANVVLRELDLPVWHLLFAGGGHFNLLLPNTQQVRDGLNDLILTLDAEMHGRFGDDLQLVIAQKAFSRKKIEGIEGNAGACFSDLNSELEKQKLQQHRSRLEKHFGGEQMTIQERKAFREKIDEWEIEVGKQFPKRHILIETVTDGPVSHTEEFPTIATFKMPQNCYSLLVAEDFSEAKAMLKDIPDLLSAQVFSFNNTDFLPKQSEWKEIPQPVSFGFRFLGKTVPMKDAPNPKTEQIENRPQTFEEIVDPSDDDALKMLAAMRLDVDDLGFIFSQGMEGASLAEIVTLSREMQYFFSAHFNGLAEKHELYLIYSGGDDAFVAGKWDNLIAFAQQLYKNFEAFVSNNEDVHFSAGIFMGNPHYPIGKISRDAEKLQKASKDSNDRKNRVSIFNHIMNWTSFDSKIELGQIFEEALENKKNLLDSEAETGEDTTIETAGRLENKGKLNSAFAYRILQLVKSSFYERAGFDSRTGQQYKRGSVDIRSFARNVENMRYLFARHGYDRKRADKAVGKLETALIGDFLKSFDFGGDAQIKSTRDYLVALNYALFKQRSKNKAD